MVRLKVNCAEKMHLEDGNGADVVGTFVRDGVKTRWIWDGKMTAARSCFATLTKLQSLRATADPIAMVTARRWRASFDCCNVKILIEMHKRRAQRKVVTHCCKDDMRHTEAV